MCMYVSAPHGLSIKRLASRIQIAYNDGLRILLKQCKWTVLIKCIDEKPNIQYKFNCRFDGTCNVTKLYAAVKPVLPCQCLFKVCCLCMCKLFVRPWVQNKNWWIDWLIICTNTVHIFICICGPFVSSVPLHHNLLCWVSSLPPTDWLLSPTPPPEWTETSFMGRTDSLTQRSFLDAHTTTNSPS